MAANLGESVGQPAKALPTRSGKPGETACSDCARKFSELRCQPCQIFFGPNDDRNGDDLRRIVAVERRDGLANGFETLACGLDGQENFAGLLDGTLPAVDALNGRKNVDASSQTSFDQGIRDARRF